MRPRSVPLLVVALVAVLLVACDGAQERADPAARAPGVPPGTTSHQSGVRLSDALVTVGTGEGCVDCHEDIAAAYHSSGMHDSLTLPTGDGSVEARMAGREVVDEETGITARMDLGDGRYLQRLIYRDPDGIERARHEMRVDLVVGSGHATRSYFQVEGELIYQLPLTWYAELDDLRLSPGPGFRSKSMRHATHLCVSCHTGWVEPSDPREELGFHGDVSLGIGCVRCHGDAEEHAMTGDPHDVANPSRMSAERQADVCEQCHLSGSLNLVKRGEPFASYTPGERLGKVYGIFEPVTGLADLGTSISGHGARMRRSRCFQESPDMTCTTCHNPHRGHREAETARDTGSGCTVCHADDACHEDEASRQGRTCAGCHMATVASNDIVHTRTTDHFIQKRPEETAPVDGAHERKSLDAFAVRDVDILNVLDPQDELPGSRLLKVRAYLDGAGMAATFRGVRANGYLERAERLLATILSERPDDAEARFERARLLAMTGNETVALVELDGLLERSPDWAAAARLRALTSLSLGNVAQSELRLREALALSPHDEDCTLALARLLADQGRAVEGLDLLDALRARSGPALRRAEAGSRLARAAGLPERGVPHAYDVLLFLPRHPEALSDAADLCREAGLPERQSRVLFEEALRRRPTHLAAITGLARLELREGNDTAARRLLAQAQRIAPGSPSVRLLEQELR